MEQKPSNNRLTWKRCIGTVWKIIPRSENRRIILIYHSVGKGPWALSVEKFQEQLIWLEQNAEVVSLNELLEKPQTSGLHVALTFDDGYKCLHTVVAPLLKEKGFTATVYLSTGQISEKKHKRSDEFQGYYPGEEFLLWKEVEELRDQGWIVGSHSIEHVDLCCLSLETIDNQVRDSKREIESRLSQLCSHFSYPWGRHNEKIRDVVCSAGYKYAVAGYHLPVSSYSNLMALPRLDVRRDYCLKDFVDVVLGNWDYLGIIHQMKKRYA